jgi:Disulphide bond corrector protein DsbC
MQKFFSRTNQILLSAFLLTFTACQRATNLESKTAQPIPKNSVQSDFENAFTWSQNFDETKQQLSVSVHLNKGFHAYAAGEKIGIPVDLEITNFNGWHLEGKPWLPTGVLKHLDAIRKTQVLENEFVLGAKVKGGKGKIRGILKMQLCSASACDRPREHHFEYDVTRGEKT